MPASAAALAIASAASDRRDRAADRTRPGLLRADLRHELRTADRASDEIGRRCRSPRRSRTGRGSRGTHARRRSAARSARARARRHRERPPRPRSAAAAGASAAAASVPIASTMTAPEAHSRSPASATASTRQLHPRHAARTGDRAPPPATSIPRARPAAATAPEQSRTASRRHRRRRPRAAPAPAPSTTRSTSSLPREPAARSRCAGSALRHGSRSGPRDQAAEPALAPAIFGDRALERRAVEIRPIDRHEHEFAVGRLPQQEIGQPLLAAGADDEIGIGQIRRVEIARRACRR